MLLQLLVFIKYIKKTDNYVLLFILLNQRNRNLQDTKKPMCSKHTFCQFFRSY